MKKEKLRKNNPLFPALRTGPMALSEASRRKQIPSSPPSGPLMSFLNGFTPKQLLSNSDYLAIGFAFWESSEVSSCKYKSPLQLIETHLCHCPCGFGGSLYFEKISNSVNPLRELPPPMCVKTTRSLVVFTGVKLISLAMPPAGISGLRA